MQPRHLHDRRMTQEAQDELDDIYKKWELKRAKPLYKSLRDIAKDRFNKVKEKLAKSENPIDILKELNEIKSILLHLLTQQKATTLVEKAKELTPKDSTETPALNQKESLEELDKVAGSKMIDDKKHYILYRPSHDFEYDKSKEDIEYTTKEDTEWTHDEATANMLREGKNPIVGAFIPEDSIKEIQNSRSNNSQMGEGLKNPQHQEIKVIVKPGTYKLYMEITP